MDGIFVAAPPGAAWQLSRDEFQAHLRQRFPQARCYEKQEPITRQDYLGFYVELDNTERHGSYFEHRNLVLEDALPGEWADTIAWFLGLLPADAPVVAVLESNPETMAPVPARADTQTIRDLLDALAED
ncbi:hypothetical protein ABH930_005828 [Kitasatospora sp. GAS204A]|uniref:hypothetical protein n=1 Tax=unclassified Kitasatospora TaxID=2633591 RepID=UPI002473A997|nr:hypothetical protein [Kitasatospora sp. GAS204B]MDH6120272.1 hypothetical protein [Kitasatospora sp. GAS204B]